MSVTSSWGSSSSALWRPGRQPALGLELDWCHLQGPRVAGGSQTAPFSRGGARGCRVVCLAEHGEPQSPPCKGHVRVHVCLCLLPRPGYIRDSRLGLCEVAFCFKLHILPRRGRHKATSAFTWVIKRAFSSWRGLRGSLMENDGGQTFWSQGLFTLLEIKDQKSFLWFVGCINIYRIAN